MRRGRRTGAVFDAMTMTMAVREDGIAHHASKWYLIPLHSGGSTVHFKWE